MTITSASVVFPTESIAVYVSTRSCSSFMPLSIPCAPSRRDTRLRRLIVLALIHCQLDVLDIACIVVLIWDIGSCALRDPGDADSICRARRDGCDGDQAILETIIDSHIKMPLHVNPITDIESAQRIQTVEFARVSLKDYAAHLKTTP